LIEVEVLKPVYTDPNFQASPGNDPPKRNQYRLTLKGRPDLKPGDLAMFDVADQDLSTTKPALAGLVGSLADMVTGPIIPTLNDDVTGNAVLMYVSSVQHKLGKDTGFVTVATGVGLGTKQSPADDGNPDLYWDGRTVASGAKAKVAHSSAESQLGQAVQDAIDQAMGQLALPEVGEVRAADASQQTVRVWRGLADGAGESYQARSLEIARPSRGDAPEAPYLTPFAWSQCGLILPRYPGTRVLVEHRQGAPDDPIDIGALWNAADVPAAAQAGDWWLILPANASPTDRFSSDSDTPKAYSDVATHDLIDAGGNRIVEVGALTVRVGKSNLTKAGGRPAAATADSIVIEHKGRAVITVDSNGNITIDAGSNDINLNANNVNVKVSGAMNVSG
jgi:hypothetical protein